MPKASNEKENHHSGRVILGCHLPFEYLNVTLGFLVFKIKLRITNRGDCLVESDYCIAHLCHNPILNSRFIAKNTSNLTIAQATDCQNNSKSKTKANNQDNKLVKTKQHFVIISKSE